MEPTKGVAEFCAEHSFDVKELAARAGMEERRIEAIVLGRWTPSPAERDKIAAVFGVSRAEIAWGHKNPISHIHGHGPQFGRSP